jgi:uncharacterized repeat protein (TIGR01451 family)
MFGFADQTGETATSLCPFANGFDLASASGTASDTSNSVTVTLGVNGIVGNGNQTAGYLPFEAGRCSDTDPMVNCDPNPGQPGLCPHFDAPDDSVSPDSETYTITLCSNPSAAGCGPSSTIVAEVTFQPAQTGGNNVQVNYGSATVLPTNIDMTQVVNHTSTFSVLIGNLPDTLLQAPWGINIDSSAQLDGPGEDTAGSRVEPPPPPVLTCEKSLSGDNVGVGSVVTATVVITNSGPTGTSLTVTDNLDVGLAYVAGTAIPSEPQVNAQVLTWTGLFVAANSSLVLQYDIVVASIPTGVTLLCDHVVVTSTDFPSIPAAQCTACLTVAPPVLTCSKSFDMDIVNVGSVVGATVVVSNLGPSPTAVQIRDTLDAGLSYVSGSSNLAEPTVAGQMLTWSGLTVPGNGSITLTYEISVSSISPGQSLCNHVVCTSLDFPGVVPGTCSDCVRTVSERIPGMTTGAAAVAAVLLILAPLGVLRRRRRRIG